MASEVRRAERVAEMALRILSELLLRELRDPRLRGVTLTSVAMTDDLRRARVFFSLLEGSARSADAIAGFRSAQGFIRKRLGDELALRYTPELDYQFDPGLERAARIDQLLRASRPRGE